MKVTADMMPVDVTAGRVLSGGEHYVSRSKFNGWSAEVCPPLRRLMPYDLNLVGVKFGRFTVMGLPREKVMLSRKTAAWIVRCACGRFEHRSAKAIRNPANFGDRCYECRKLAENRVVHEWHTAGRQLDWRNL